MNNATNNCAARNSQNEQIEAWAKAHPRAGMRVITVEQARSEGIDVKGDPMDKTIVIGFGPQSKD